MLYVCVFPNEVPKSREKKSKSRKSVCIIHISHAITYFRKTKCIIKMDYEFKITLTVNEFYYASVSNANDETVLDYRNTNTVISVKNAHTRDLHSAHNVC